MTAITRVLQTSAANFISRPKSFRPRCSLTSVAMGAPEAEYTYKWPRPAVTVDTCIIASPQPGSQTKVLLIQRKHDPFAGMWCLPGGFVDAKEPLYDAAARELQEETSVDPASVILQQVGAYGDPERDPRGWTVTIAYAALVPSTDLGVKAADDAANAQWYAVTDVPAMAFDHKLIVRECFEHIAKLPETQEMSELQSDLAQGIHHLAGDWRDRS